MDGPIRAEQCQHKLASHKRLRDYRTNDQRLMKCQDRIPARIRVLARPPMGFLWTREFIVRLP